MLAFVRKFRGEFLEAARKGGVADGRLDRAVVSLLGGRAA
jgi:hypothetical protein